MTITQTRSDVSCCRCGRDIVSVSPRTWRHVAADGSLWNGCRAASFTDEGWDDALPRTWYAAPSND